MDERMSYIWLAAIIVAAVVEGSTVQLVSIWFVAGGIGALIAELCGAAVWLQIVVFVAVTALTLIFTRPLVKKLMNFKREDTNAGRYIGKTGLVTVKINNQLGTGQVNVMGSIWTARSKSGAVIDAGKNVQVEAIEGVKLIVDLSALEGTDEA